MTVMFLKGDETHYVRLHTYMFRIPFTSHRMTRARRSTAVTSLRKIFVNRSRICSELSGSSEGATMRGAYMKTGIESRGTAKFHGMALVNLLNRTGYPSP